MDISGIDYLGLDRVLKRGSGKILAERDHAFLVYDKISGAYLLACNDMTADISLLDRYAGQDCDLLMVSNHALGNAAFERYGFSEKLVCYQVAYYGQKPPLDARLTVRTADETDFAMLSETYRLIRAEELEMVIKRKSILLGYHEGRLVGFIGEHLEGSMGLLYVFPEHRRKGFGTALQAHFMAKTMESGWIPFGQVEKDNQSSLRMQNKLGMTRSDNLMVWMWK
ncbi:MAG: GNAT family N-acetyltransferase [Clostridia bacterium]|nr:GNAT family N-acetyltransferase [Clostridia bacterium]